MNIEKLIKQVRDLGSNIMVDGDKLVIVHRDRLSPEMLYQIRSDAKSIAKFVGIETDLAERMAIIEMDGGISPAAAEMFARILQARRPARWSEADWSMFIDDVGKILDETLRRH